jgi:hypothetical protein
MFSGIPENDNMSLRPESIEWVRPLGNRPLAIIAWFEKFKQKEMTKSRCRELRNTDFGMNDHFPHRDQ